MLSNSHDGRCSYDFVRIWFPQDASKLNKYAAPQVHGNKVHFIVEGLGVTAHATRYKLPPGLTIHYAITKYIIAPMQYSISNDLESSLGLFGELRQLAKAEVTSDSLEYRKLLNNGCTFSVFDSSAKDIKIFEHLLKLRQSDAGLLRSQQDLPKQTTYIHQDYQDEKPGRCYVNGKNLKEAIGRALVFYNLTAQFRKIDSKKSGSSEI